MSEEVDEWRESIMLMFEQWQEPIAVLFVLVAFTLGLASVRSMG